MGGRTQSRRWRIGGLCLPFPAIKMYQHKFFAFLIQGGGMEAYLLRLSLRLNQLLTEDLPVAIIARLINDDRLEVIRQLVDYEFEVLAQLELVEPLDAFGCDLDSVLGLSVYFEAVDRCL